MFNRFRFIALFAVAVGIAYFSLNFTGTISIVNAQDAPQPNTPTEAPAPKVCPETKKGECPSSKAAVCDKSKKECSSKTACDSEKKECASKSSCCKHKEECGSQKKCSKGGDGHSVASMLSLVHCAKKELLKEKIKEKLNKKMGKQLNEIADLLVNAVMEQHKAGSDAKLDIEKLETQFKELCTAHAKGK